MAAGDNGPKWPGPVTFNDDDPKKGFCTVFLTAPKMTVKTKLIGGNQPKNASLDVDIQSESVCVEIEVTPKATKGDKDPESVKYEYKKNLPEDCDPKKSSYKVKDEQVILSICKAKSESWAAHAKYMIKKE